MPMTPPGRTRRLGRSRRFTCTNLPDKFRQWHAPRANRWERVCVLDGRLQVQWLAVSGVVTQWLEADSQHWIAPGNRWRVAHMDAGAGFELEVYADETVAAAAPQSLRAGLLDGLPVVRVAGASGPARVLSGLIAGQRLLLETDSEGGRSLLATVRQADDALSWHPLEASVGRWVAVVERCAQPVGLAEYLGRDHALIEAVLAGALGGRSDHEPWLHNVLARHLGFEEELLFPAYLKAGGRHGWIRGLLNEHEQLRRHLPRLDDASSRRRFLLLLDGHDEKEERIVYPDIIEHLADGAGTIARTIMHYPLVSEST